MVEARVRRRQSVRIVPIFADHQRLEFCLRTGQETGAQNKRPRKRAKRGKETGKCEKKTRYSGGPHIKIILLRKYRLKNVRKNKK